jgi:chemotaxis protein methyltransferase WspC
MRLLKEIEKLLQLEIGIDSEILGTDRLIYILRKRQSQLNIDEDIYYNSLKNSSEEFAHLVEEIVVPETWFFRDKQPFEYLKSYVSSRKLTKPIKLLSAPCSSGEEPYSIAISLLESGLSPRNFTIEAIDISHRAIGKASKGIYGKNSFRGDFNYQKYFEPVKQGYQLLPEVCNMVIFKQGNILNVNNFPEAHYDVIFCRNLLIYLDRVVAKKLIEKITNSLKLGGILFVGSAETIHIPLESYVSLNQPFTFAYQKIQLPKEISLAQNSTTPKPLLSCPKQPKKEESELIRARKLADMGKLEESINLCKNYLNQCSLSIEAHILLGELYQASSNTIKAEECFQKALYLDPNDSQAVNYLLLLKEQRGDPKEVKILRKRLERLNQQKQTYKTYK